MDDASASLHFAQNIVRNLAKTASKQLSELAQVDATEALGEEEPILVKVGRTPLQCRHPPRFQ